MLKDKILGMMTRMIDRRDELIFRRLGGEKLSSLEEKTVSLVDKVLDYSLPAPELLPESIKGTIEEMNALARERK